MNEEMNNNDSLQENKIIESGTQASATDAMNNSLGANPYTFNYVPAKRKKSEHLLKFESEFPFYIIASLIYATIYTFCLYENYNSIFSVVYGVVTISFYYLCIKKLGVNIGKEIVYYVSGIMLLCINLCLTTDGVLVFLDHVGMNLLLLAGLLHIFYDDIKWGLGKYLSSILTLGVTAFGNGFSVINDWVGFSKTRNEKSKSKVLLYIVIGIGCSLPLLFFVTILLASADKFFGDFVASILDSIFALNLFDNFGIVLLFLFGLIISYGMVRTLAEHSINSDVYDSGKYSAVVAITINFMIGFVYLIFSGFQIFYLFLGKMTLPSDYSYAEYAREGFFQLVVVCLINMVLVLICMHFFENNKVLKAALLLISACTFIMIASSAMRMIMYVSAYQLSYTRVFVFLGLIIILLLMIGIVINICRSEFPLFKYSMIVVAVCYITFAFSNPCNIIAANNLDQRFCRASGGESSYSDIDFNYICLHLPADAAPAIEKAILRENNEEFTRKFEKYFKKNVRKDISFRKFNISESRCKRISNRIGMSI